MQNRESLFQQRREKRIASFLPRSAIRFFSVSMFFLSLILGIGRWVLSLVLHAAKGGAPNPVKWIYTTGNTIFSRPAIGSDESIYVSSTPVIAEERGSRIASPAIGLDGTIYAGSTDGRLYRLSRDGKE